MSHRIVWLSHSDERVYPNELAAAADLDGIYGPGEWRWGPGTVELIYDPNDWRAVAIVEEFQATG